MLPHYIPRLQAKQGDGPETVPLSCFIALLQWRQYALYSLSDISFSPDIVQLLNVYRV